MTITIRTTTLDYYTRISSHCCECNKKLSPTSYIYVCEKPIGNHPEITKKIFVFSTNNNNISA